MNGFGRINLLSKRKAPHSEGLFSMSIFPMQQRAQRTPIANNNLP